MTSGQAQLARVQFLSRRFLELQGLRVALAGATIAVVFGSYLLTATPTPHGGLVALGVTFALMIPGQLWAHQYYARTAGRQVRAQKNVWWTVAFLMAYWLTSWFLHRQFPALPAGTPTLQVVVLASLIVAIRDWRWRAHYLLTAVIPATTFTMAALRGDAIDPGLTLSATLLATGVSMVMVGVLDHRLLMKLLAEARSAAPESQIALP